MTNDFLLITIRLSRFLSKENNRESCTPPINPTAASASKAFRSFGDSPLTKSDRFIFDGIRVQCSDQSCDKEYGLSDIPVTSLDYPLKDQMNFRYLIFCESKNTP